MFNEFKSVTRRPAYRSEAEVKSDRLGAIFFELVNKKKNIQELNIAAQQKPGRRSVHGKRADILRLRGNMGYSEPFQPEL